MMSEWEETQMLRAIEALERQNEHLERIAKALDRIARVEYRGAFLVQKR